jgi:hypothetical protein
VSCAFLTKKVSKAGVADVTADFGAERTQSA